MSGAEALVKRRPQGSGLSLEAEMTELNSGLRSCGYVHDEARLGLLVGALLGAKFRYVEDIVGTVSLQGLDSFADIPADDIAFVLRVADGVALEESRARSQNASMHALKTEVADAAARARCPADISVGVGPGFAAKRLAPQLLDGPSRKRWAAQARVDALLGSCPRSHKSMLSGLRCYMNFAETCLGKAGRALPPTVDDILAWSRLFRCDGTFTNYLGYLRLGCELLHFSTEALDSDAVRRAKRTVRKKRAFVPRERMFIQRPVVAQMVSLAASGAEGRTLVMLFVCCYAFMLRLPSEGLPIIRGGVGFDAGDSHPQAVMYLDGATLCLKLARRKNLPEGALLRRSCWCSSCKVTCPVHALWPFIKQHDFGQKPFGGISSALALSSVRKLLALLDVPDASKYRTHDLRRGHAKDMQVHGAKLCEILHAGQWKSPAFMEYLDLNQLEHDAVLEAHLAESSDGEED